MKPVTFGIVIPAKNPDPAGLERTIRSIATQDSNPGSSLECRIVLVHVGMGSDLIQLAHDWAWPFEIETHQDSTTGMYAAIHDGFQRLTDCDIITYLGVGDRLEPQAFAIVKEITALRGCNSTWITGVISSRREDGALVRSLLPASYRTRGLRRGIYGRLLPTLQQESTFWSSDLLDTIDPEFFRSLRLAGDFYLWWSFSTRTTPIVLESQLGSFVWHGDNQSADWDAYTEELTRFLPPLSLADRLWAFPQRLAWALPNKLKRKWGGGRVLRWRWPDGPWH